MDRKRNIKLRKALSLLLAVAVYLSASNAAYPSPIFSHALRVASHANSPHSARQLLAEGLSGKGKAAPEPVATPSSAGDARLVTNLKAAIFDLDGVLIASTRTHYGVWKRVFEDEFRREDYHYPAREFTYEEFLEKVHGRLRTEAVKNVLTEHSEEEISALAATVRSLFIEELMGNSIKVIEQVKTLAEELKREGLKVAVATSLEQADTILKRLGIRDIFDEVVEPSAKSYPIGEKEGIYSIAIKRLGVRPAECVAFEDSRPGIEAVKKAGVLCIAVSDIDEAAIKGSAVKTITLEELNSKAVRDIYEERPPAVVKSFKTATETYLKERLTIDDNLLKSGREPRTSWESLFYYLHTSKFYLSVDQDFDTSEVVIPTRTDSLVDSRISYMTSDVYRDPSTDLIYYDSDLPGLSKDIQDRCVPAYIIHISKKTSDRYKDQQERIRFLADLLIHKWIERFMPEFWPAGLPDKGYVPHEGLFKPNEALLEPLSAAAKARQPELLYGMLDSYLVFHDPAGLFKRAIFEALKDIEHSHGANLLVNAIKSEADLIAWYCYQFEYKGLSVSELSALLHQYERGNKVVKQNLKGTEGSCFFTFRHPQTSQILYLPQNISLRDNENLEEVKFISDADREKAIVEIGTLEKEKSRLRAEMRRLQGEKRGQVELSRDEGIDATMKILVETSIDDLNIKIRELNSQIREISQRQIYLYGSRLIDDIQNKAEDHKRTSRKPLVIGIWGATSTGKNTFCEINRNALYASRLYNEEEGEILIVGSDNFLHAGRHGRYEESQTDDGVARFSILTGQGIFDLKKLGVDLSSLLINRPIVLFPDQHDHAYETGRTQAVITGPEVRLILANFASLGIDEDIRGKLDLLIAVVFKDGRKQLERMLIRDRQNKEEGGMRGFSVDELLKMYVVLWFLEKKQAMQKTMFMQADFIWSQDNFKLYRVRRDNEQPALDLPKPEPAGTSRILIKITNDMEISQAA